MLIAWGVKREMSVSSDMKDMVRMAWLSTYIESCLRWGMLPLQ